VFSASLVSPGFVVLIPPKNTRREVSGMRRRSGWDIVDQGLIATLAAPTLPAALTVRYASSSLVPASRV
jgi:hypothetical protein